MTESHAIPETIAGSIPEFHPLYLLQIIVAQPIEQTLDRLRKDGSSGSDLPLEQALRASLLQALYSINDFEQLEDHLKFNQLFRWFVGYKNEDFFWDSTLYAQLFRQLNNEQELRQFFDLVITAARAEDKPAYAQMAISLEHWVDIHCPRIVYFRHYTKSPVQEVHYTIEGVTQDVGQCLFPSHILYEHIKEMFPVKETIQQRREYMPSFVSENGSYRTISDGDQLNFVFKGQYETWEDTIKPHIENVIAGARATYDQARICRAWLLFTNHFELPAEVELSDYFHMLPQLPPHVVPPRVMREQNIAYSFPKKMMQAYYTTDLCFNDVSRYIEVTYKIRPEERHLDVTLDLESQWCGYEDEAATMADVTALADQLKQDVYVAFHSLLTDRTRELLE